MSENPISNIAIVIFLFILLLVTLFGKKKSKQELAKEYGISRPTFGKWVTHFHIGCEKDEWKKRKILSPLEIASIKSSLGDDMSFVLSKKQIAELAESNYKTVKENVILNLDKIGISLEAWQSCSVFPPSVSKRILEVLG